MPEQFLLEVERQLAMLDADSRWLDSLIARLERRRLPLGSAELPPSAICKTERPHGND